MQVGGFNQHLKVYGGGEPYLSYKLEMLGYINVLEPRASVSHLAAERGYSWNNDILWKNFLLAAYALGGKSFSDRFYKHYQSCCNGVPRYLEKLEQLYSEAQAEGEEDRLFIAARQCKSVEFVHSPINYDNRSIPVL